MTRIKRYIFSQVLIFTVGVMMFFIGIDALINLITLTEELPNASFLELIWLTLLATPQKMVFYFPVGVLLGTLVALGAMATHSELVIFRSIGISLVRIYWMSLRPALLLCLLALAASEWLIPKTELMMVNTKSKIENPERVLSVQEGIWQKDGDMFFHIDLVEPNGRLLGITQFSFDEQGQLVETGKARMASFDGEQWILHEDQRTFFANQQIVNSLMARRAWATSLRPGLFQQLVFEPSQLAPSKLYQHIQQVKQQGLRTDELELSLWNKLFQPVVVAIMVFIALAFIFGPLRSVSSSLRIVTGIVAGLMYTYSQEFFTRVGLVYQVEPLISVLLPLILFGLFGAFLIRRAG
ncbi:MAG: LPS export ABC transporter permease LptG [Pseudomonadota bacterium]|nr:LPS export ABC transporter permease LptG [Pseudomonadota bacterium]